MGWLVLAMFFSLQIMSGNCKNPTIIFTTSTPTLQPPATRLLTLRCAVWNRHPGNAGDGKSRCIEPYPCISNTRLCFKCFLAGVEASRFKRCKLLQYDSEDHQFQKGHRLLVRPGDMQYSAGLDPQVGGRSCSTSVAFEHLGQGSFEFTMEFWGKGGKKLGFSDMSYTLGDADDGDFILKVTSLTLLHRGKEVAILMAGDKARLLSNASNMEVKGEVKPLQPERGYLTVTWTYPSVYETGDYICDVTGVDTTGHNFVFSRTLEIVEDDVSIEDLVHSLSVLQQDNLALRTKCSGHLDISALAAENHKLRAEIQRLDVTLTETTQALEQMAHVESGYLDCGDSSTWRGRDLDYRYRNVTVTFSHVYASPPAVHLAVFSRTSVGAAGNTYYASLVVTSGQAFTVACGVPAGKGRVYNTRVHWISIPAA